jgi:hypothetical protein
MPYAIHLLGELAESDAEIGRARRGLWKQLDVDGQVAKNFLWVVKQHGQPTLARIARECLNTEIPVATSYMRALRKAGLVRTTRNKRGGLVVYLPKGAK